MTERKKICITGGCGFIFSNFIRKLIYDKLPYDIVNIDRVNNPISLNTLKIHNRHTFYLADIRDRHIMNNIFEVEKPDYVIHTAAQSSVDYSLKNPEEFISSNVIGTQVVVDLCVKYQVKKLIYTGTDEIYGSLEIDDETKWTENSPPNPQNYYSSSKYAGECIVQSAGKGFGLPFNITRSSNNYGRAQTTDKLIPRVIKCCLEKKQIPIYGKGDNIRDWMFVIDSYHAIMKILEKAPSGEIYNIGANQEYSNIEVVKMICDIIGDNSFNLIKFIEDRKGHDKKYSMSCDKIKQIGWAPTVKFKNGLPATIEWYMLNNFYLK